MVARPQRVRTPRRIVPHTLRVLYPVPTAAAPSSFYQTLQGGLDLAHITPDAVYPNDLGLELLRNVPQAGSFPFDSQHPVLQLRGREIG